MAEAAASDFSEVPTFRPTLEEFRGFSRFVRWLQHQPEYRRTGLAKVVPPPGWADFDLEAATHGMTITPIVQAPMSQGSGRVQLGIQEGKPLSFDEFKAWGEHPSQACPAAVSGGSVDWRKVERRLWSSLSTTAEPPRYGSDNLGTLFGDQDASGWNINCLDSELQLLGDIPGVTRSMLYFGTWRSVFAWHTEDVDLFSLNLLHFGAPKFWYSVGPEHAGRLEQLAAAAFPDVLKETRCRRFLRHKTTMLSPEQLKKAGIPFVRAIQRPGEIMLTYAGAYHAGFNTGFNCAESANFVAPLWWPQGEKAVHSMCICRPDHVRINLAALRQAVEEFQRRGGEREWSAAGCAPTARAGAAAASGRSQSAVCGADMAGLTRDSSSGGGSDGGASSPKPWLAGHAMSIAPGLARELSWPELPRSTLDLGSADEFGGFVRFRANVIDSGEWNWSQRAEDGMPASRPALAEPLGRSQIRVAKCLPGAVEGGAEPSVSGTGRGAGSPLRQLLAKLEPWRARLLRETLAYCAADPVPTGSKGARPGQRAAAGPPAVWVQWTDGSMFSGWAIEYGSGSVRVHYPGYRRTEDEWHGIDDDAIAARADPSDYCWRRPAGWMAASSFMEVTVAKGKGTPGDLGTERVAAAPQKMVLVVRADLKMGKGKAAAQCSHAAVSAVERARKANARGLSQWMMDGQAKVVVRCDDEDTLLNVVQAARAAGLVTSTVRDAGRTQLEPGTRTVAAVGPGPSVDIDRITGGLKLL